MMVSTMESAWTKIKIVMTWMPRERPLVSPKSSTTARTTTVTCRPAMKMGTRMATGIGLQIIWCCWVTTKWTMIWMFPSVFDDCWDDPELAASSLDMEPFDSFSTLIASQINLGLRTVHMTASIKTAKAMMTGIGMVTATRACITRTMI